MIQDKLGTETLWDVTDETNDILVRVNPYYLLVNGRPLPFVVMEETEDGQEARRFLTRWLALATKEQKNFCGLGLWG